MDDMPVFKSFLREQLENQRELEKAIKGIGKGGRHISRPIQKKIITFNRK